MQMPQTPDSMYLQLFSPCDGWVNSWEGSAEMSKRDVPVKLWENKGSDWPQLQLRKLTLSYDD